MYSDEQGTMNYALSIKKADLLSALALARSAHVSIVWFTPNLGCRFAE
jgi:hypothetical protein